MRLFLAVVALSLVHAACNSSSKPNAADDPNRAVGGVITLSDKEPAQALGTGPMFLTDVMIDGRAGEIFTSRDSTCKEHDAGDLFGWRSVADDQPYAVQAHHGMRLLVGSGRTLCFHAWAGATQLVWAGFRP